MKLFFHITKKLRMLNYKQKITSVMLVFTMIPMIILGLFTYISVMNAFENSVFEQYDYKLKGGISKFNVVAMDTIDKMSFAANYYPLYELLNIRSKPQLYNIVETYNELNNVMQALLPDKVNSIRIYTSNPYILESNYIKSINHIEKYPYYNELSKLEDGETLWKFNEIKDKGEDNRNYFGVYKKYSMLENDTTIMEVLIPYNVIEKFFGFELPENAFVVHVLKNNEFHILNSNGLSNNKLTEIYRQIQNDGHSGNYRVISGDIGGTYSKVMAIIPEEFFLAKVRNMIIVFVVIMSLAFVLVIMAVNYTSKTLTKRLSGIIEAIRYDFDNIFAGKTAPSAEEPNDEFSVIIKKFTELTQKVREETHKELNYRRQTHMLELKLLQEKINPHFLYNTLSAIKWVYNDKSLGEVIDSMVKYYRVALNKGSDYISIKKEMEGIEEYLKLQKFAYAKEFTFDINIQPELKRCLILKHLIQPIIENSFIHGINSLPQGSGKIFVDVYKESGDIIITITDNGKGIPLEKLVLIKENKYLSSQEEGGYALANIVDRIKLSYGEKYGIHVESTIGNGATVKLILPILDENINN